VLEPGEACFGRTVLPAPHLTAYTGEVEDRNRDGRDDLVSYGFGEFYGEVDGLSVFVNRGDGSFELAWMGPFGELFDLDDDGCLDSANVFTSSVTWWRCAEDGTFVVDATYSIAPSTEFTGGTALIADLGSDGTPDLIRVADPDPYPDTLIVHTFNGEEFELAIDVPLNDDSWSLDTIDWDGDGALDLLLVGYSYAGNDTRLLVRWSDGRLLDPVELPLLRGGRWLASIDLDGILPLDFAVLGDGSTRLLVNHAGFLEELPPISSLFVGGRLDFAQADGDPMTELVDIQQFDGPAVIRDLPSGEVLRELFPPFEALWAHSGWDANRDGIDDLVISGEANHVHLRGSDGSLADPFLFQTQNFADVLSRSLDADSDALMDLVNDQSGITLGRRQSTVVGVPEFLKGIEEVWIDLGIGDFGADEIPDVVVLSEGGALFTLRGNGRALEAPEVRLERIEAFDIALVDADLLPDLAIASTGSIGIALSDPAGGIVPPLDFVALGSPVLEIETADVNGDGFSDVVYRTAALVGTLLGDGTGMLVSQATWPTREADVLCADLDTDGASEILLREGDELLVLDARTELTLKTQVATDSPYTSALAAGDFDRDGDLDVVVLGSRDLVQFDGDGNGGFAAMHEVLVAWFADSLLAADVDGHTGTDLLVSEEGWVSDATSVRVMIPDPSGLRTSRRFTNGTTYTRDHRVSPLPRLGVADINLDGAPDIVSTRRGQVRVFYAYP
jgi:hypothetical protein